MFVPMKIINLKIPSCVLFSEVCQFKINIKAYAELIQYYYA